MMNGQTLRQLEKFKAAAREIEADDDADCFREMVRKSVKHKSVEKSE